MEAWRRRDDELQHSIHPLRVLLRGGTAGMDEDSWRGRGGEGGADGERCREWGGGGGVEGKGLEGEESRRKGARRIYVGLSKKKSWLRGGAGLCLV